MKSDINIWITGDTHGGLDIEKLKSKNWKEGKHLSKSDYLIILGDFGFLWESRSDKTEKYWLDWLDKQNYTTLFIDGNHENHIRLERLEKVDMFGSKVGKVTDSIYHLRRGEVYTIADSTFFCFGGATSADRKDRVEYEDWWHQEVPTESELKYGLDNLSKHDYKVDYLLFHTIPTSIHNKIPHKKSKAYLNDPTCKMLDEIFKRTTFKKGFSGHFHIDYEIDYWNVLFEKVVKIK